MAGSETESAGDARKVLVLFNRRAGARDAEQQVEALCGALVQRGMHVERLETLAEVERANEEFGAGRLRGVVAAGGDGTARAVLERTVRGVPIALLPLGTENLLARFCKIPRDPEGVARIVEAGYSRVLDAARANGQLFLLMAGIGFDAAVVERVHTKRQGHITHWSYVKPIWDEIRSYEYPELEIGADGGPGTTAMPMVNCCRWAFVCNLPCYAVGLKFVPEANPSDGLLDVCMLRKGSLWNGLRYLAAAWMGRLQSLSDCQVVQGESITIQSRWPVPYQLDGDHGGMLPLRIEAVPGRLRLLVDAEAKFG